MKGDYPLKEGNTTAVEETVTGWKNVTAIP
jgi:hypothetical protein